MSTLQVNDLVDAFIVHELEACPASKGQYGYAYALNASRNHVVCHGVPSATDILQGRDIVNFDITLEKNGYSVVREYGGHGIGREMHEEPQVLHWAKPQKGLLLQEGMVFTSEPMINQGRASVRTEADGWTVVTRDGRLSAQFEHTVAVTRHGVQVLTLRDGEGVPH